jgi:uncharacterized small protein (DUF1192 family)|tara:strand:- start:2466 stop:2666 length:201 start_codon:yes stop_codon:yes gene_type:complete
MTKLEELRGKIAAIPMDEIRIAVLQDEIEVYKSRIEPHDTGYLHDAIAQLNRRIAELGEYGTNRRN